MSGPTANPQPRSGSGAILEFLRLEAAIARLFVVLESALLALVSAVVIYVVAQRFLVGATPPWADELPRLILIWMTLLAAALGLRNDTHLRPGMPPIFGAAAQRWVHLLNEVVIMLVLGAVGVAGWTLSATVGEQLTPALQAPIALFYGAIPVTFAFAIWFVLARIVRTLSP